MKMTSALRCEEQKAVTSSIKGNLQSLLSAQQAQSPQDRKPAKTVNSQVQGFFLPFENKIRKRTSYLELMGSYLQKKD